MQTSMSNMAPMTGYRGFTMDTPFRRGSAGQTHLTRMLGHVINNPGLAQVKPGDKPSQVMVRANNLASLTAAMLLKIRPEKREDALMQIGGLAYTQDVLAFAKNYPGALGVSDAIRFSLALHFLVGIMHNERGEASFYADGYLKFASFFKKVQNDRIGRSSGNLKGVGLGGLGQHPILAFEDWPKGNETPAQAQARARARAASWDKWCNDNAGVTYDPALRNKCLNPGLSCDTKDPATPDGRSCRGLNTGWMRPPPAGVTYPAPPDIPSVNMATVQAASCGDLFAPLDKRKQDKLAAIRRYFQTIFGRPPNNAEVEYFGKMRACAGGPNATDDTMKLLMTRIRDAIIAKQIPNTTPQPIEGGVVIPYDMAFRDVGTDITDGLTKAADAAFDFLGKTADFIADIMCQGFKALFGPQVGAVICDIITFLTRSTVAGIAAVIDVVIVSLQGTFEFIKLMIAGKVEQAFLALMRSLGRALFSLASPIMIPVLMNNCEKVGTQIVCKGMSMSQAYQKLKEKADRVVKKEPLWPIMVIIAIVGMFSAMTGNVLDPLMKLILAIAPMAATFISEPLRLHIKELATIALDELEGSIVKFIKFVLMLVQGIMKIGELIGKFKGQLVAYFKKKGFAGLTGATNAQGKPASATERIKYIIDKLSNGINVVVNAIGKFNVKDLTTAAEPLLNLIPDLLMAILPDDAADADAIPTLTDWRKGVTATVTNVNEAEKVLKQGAVDIMAQVGKVTRIEFYKEQIAPMPAHEAAAIVANVVGTQFKTNKAAFPDFVAAFRAEMLKV